MTSPADIVIPSSAPKADAYWYHNDPAGIRAAAERGMARALSGDWSSGSTADRVRDFRGLLVFRAWIVARLSGTAGLSEKGPLVIAPEYQGSGEPGRVDAVRRLGKTNLLLARQFASFGDYAVPKILQTGAGETGALPLVAVAIVTVVVAVAESAAVAYLAHQAAQVVDNLLQRNADARAMAAADAQALKVLDSHVEQETAAGKALPLNDVEKRLLDELDRRQGILEKKQTPKIDDGGFLGLPGWAAPLAIAAGVVAVVLFVK